MNPKSSNVWAILGAIRFFLALIVVVTHLLSVIPDASGLLFAFAKLSAFAAVLGFFVISGYSIAASYAKEPGWILLPESHSHSALYVLAVAFSSVAIIRLGGVPTKWPIAVGNLFFMQGFLCETIRTNEMLWTISIEVFFYLFAPMLARLSAASIAALIAASGILYVVAYYHATPYYPQLRGGAAVPLLAWSWLLGFLAFKVQKPSATALLILVVTGVLLTLAPSFLSPGWPITIIVVALGIGFAPRMRVPEPFAQFYEFLGDLSYPLYLYHYPLFLVYYGLHHPRPADKSGSKRLHALPPQNRHSRALHHGTSERLNLVGTRRRSWTGTAQASGGGSALRPPSSPRKIRRNEHQSVRAVFSCKIRTGFHRRQRRQQRSSQANPFCPMTPRTKPGRSSRSSESELLRFLCFLL